MIHKDSGVPRTWSEFRLGTETWIYEQSFRFGTLLGFMHTEKRSRWTWPLPGWCFTKSDNFEWSTSNKFDQGRAYFQKKISKGFCMWVVFVKIFSTWILQEGRKRPEKTYDVSFSVYYQGFYDSVIFDNMTDGILEFLESGSMNGSGRFENCNFKSKAYNVI